MVSLQTAISPAEEEEEPCTGLESHMVSRKRNSSAMEVCKSTKKAREEEEGGVMELNLLDAHPEIKSKVDPRAMKVSLNLDLELNLSCTPLKTGCVFNGGEEEDEERRTTEEEEEEAIEEMVATVCMRCHMLVMMTKVALSCPNCKFVHSPDQSSSLALIKPV